MSEHNRPLNLLLVRTYQTNDGEKKDYCRIGHAWPHRDGPGFNLEIYTMPGVELTALPPKEAEPRDEKRDERPRDERPRSSYADRRGR